MRGEDWERELELGLGAAGGPESGRCRCRPESGRCGSSRIRALPVVANPGATGRPTAIDHRESELALGPEHSPRDGDKWRTACRQPSCRSDDRFWERKVRGEDWERELELGLALPVDPNPGARGVVPNPGAAAGRPESGRCRSSRIRALPVVPLPATTRKASWRLERSTDRETAISRGTARGQPRCRSDDRFWERKVRDEHWERELELGWALPVDPNTGAAGRPHCGRCRSSGIRAVPIVPNPCGADRPEPGRTAGIPECGRCLSSHCQLLQGKRVGAWLGAAGRPESGRCRSSHCQRPHGKRVGAWNGAQTERRR